MRSTLIRATAIATLSLLVTSALAAQSAGSYGKLGSTERSGLMPLGPAPSNPFAVGAQLGYTIAGGAGDFSNDLVASGLIKITPITGGFASLHIFTNLSGLSASSLEDLKAIKDKLREATNSARGLDGRFYLEHTTANERPRQGAFWLSIGARVNAAKRADSSTVYLGQLRGSLGAELRLFRTGKTAQPVTLSAELWAGHLLSDEAQTLLQRSSRTMVTLEPTLIVPLALFNIKTGFGANAALLGQAVVGVNNDLPSYGRIGIVVVKAND